MFIISVLGILPTMSYAGSVKEEPAGNTQNSIFSIQSGDQVRLNGRIRVKGSVPFTFTVLETSDGREYELSGEKAEILRRQFELKVVTLKGEVLSAGDGVRPPLIKVASYRAAERN